MNCAQSSSDLSLKMLWRSFLTLTLVAYFCSSVDLFAQNAGDKKKNEAVENPFPNRHPAADFEGGIEWLNAAGPISLKDLRGKVVLVDFWTFCCINCMHVLPDLHYLEKKFPNELVVIGVHSAKFDNEKDTGNIRKAILRYEIEHPVVNDANMVLWRKFGVNSWPSLVLIDPEGQYCGYISGEGHRDTLEQVIERVIEYHKAKGTLDETPVHFDLERNKAAQSALRFPGKILADEPHGRLFVSDSNHNRIVISSLDGQLIDVIGSGAIGNQDGTYAEAQFDHPQGMALVGDLLYVADTENHLLRTVDLSQKTVTTLAGTGEQSRGRSPGGKLLETGINSPWDLTVVDGVLYIAMAGPHQIWAHKLGSDSLWQYAGSGREDIQNGDLEHAALAQPSGIVNDGKFLYVVDSEGSAVRKITTTPDNDLTNPKGKVTTIAGTHDLPRGRSLFEFGDVDGTGTEARLQHPLGIAIHDGALFVADSYNHKIKRIDLKKNKVTTWAGTGKHPGQGLSPVQFAEPAGIAFAGQKMFVSDTNNHRLLAIDLESKEAKEFMIAGLMAPKLEETETAPPTVAASKLIDVERKELPAGDGIPVEVDFVFPDGFKLNELLPVTYRVSIEGEQSLFAKDQLNVKHEAKSTAKVSTFTIPTSSKIGAATIVLSITYGYCRDGNGGVCKVATTSWKIPIELKDGAKTTSLKLNVKAK